MDRPRPRTAEDLERKYNFEKLARELKEALGRIEKLEQQVAAMKEAAGSE